MRWFTPAQSNASEIISVPTEQKAAPLASMFAISGQGQAVWSPDDYASLARNGFMKNPVVHRCVRLIAETAAAIPLLAYQDAQELDEHPILKLLSRPNSNQSGTEFLEALIGQLLVGGNAYVEMIAIEDEPRELYALRPDRVKVLADRQGWVEGYEYSSTRGKTRLMVDVVGRSPVLHLTLFNPLDDHYGFAHLRAALMALDMHNSANAWNKALLDNSARPSGALVYSGKEGTNLTDDQFDRLKQELEAGYTGSRNAGRPMLLEGGLDWKAMGYSPRDMDFIDARNGAARDIALAFGVPPMLLGIPGDNTYSNYQEANRAFARQTVLPLIRRTVDAMGNWLAQRYEEPVRLAIDDDRVEGLSAERDALWKRLAAAEFLDDDEKREALGYSPRQPARSGGGA
ncbi:phage portal protein [Pseudahrensia aquimaris]|uniref:Phage portal protein n=1 Tax=Pseudahrensia aquimaris TaxID=744461 RepID=A0ABW3FEJ6_9HYPH